MSERDNIIEPDWSEKWTAKEAEHELLDFKFKGVGWYRSPNYNTVGIDRFDMMLVRPYGKPIPGVGSQRYSFEIFGARDPRETFKQISEMPTYE